MIEFPAIVLPHGRLILPDHKIKVELLQGFSLVTLSFLWHALAPNREDQEPILVRGFSVYSVRAALELQSH